MWAQWAPKTSGKGAWQHQVWQEGGKTGSAAQRVGVWVHRRFGGHLAMLNIIRDAHTLHPSSSTSRYTP